MFKIRAGNCRLTVYVMIAVPFQAVILKFVCYLMDKIGKFNPIDAPASMSHFSGLHISFFSKEFTVLLIS
jgi:hypothetical protein